MGKFITVFLHPVEFIQFKAFNPIKGGGGSTTLYKNIL
jgi:hypothetical protein